MIKSGRYRVLILIGIVLTSSAIRIHAQLGIIRSSNPDSVRMESLYDQARYLFSQGMNLDALNNAEESLQLAMSFNKPVLETSLLELIGDIYHASDASANAIPYFLRTAGVFESKRDTDGMLRIYKKIAEAYRNEEVHSKEQEYYEKVLSLIPPEQKNLRNDIRAQIGFAAYHGGNYDGAYNSFNSLLLAYPSGSEKWFDLHWDLVKVFDGMESYDSAMYHCRILLSAYEKEDAEEERIRLLNNIGYYQTLQGNYDTASESYMQAIALAENNGVERQELAQMKSNAAICHTNMGARNEAIDQFNEAIEIFDAEADFADKSRNENMLANVYFETGDLYNAGLFCRSAITSSKLASDVWREAEAYHTYSKVLREGNDPVNALEYYEKYLAIRDSIEFSRRMKMEQMVHRQNQLEQQERDLQLRIKEDEVSELAIRQLRLQNDAIEQEKELLMQERNLEMYKQDSLRQSMIILDQRHLVDQQEKEKLLLAQEARLADEARAREVLKQESLERENTLLEQQQKLDQLELERQKNTKKAMVAAVIAAGLIVLLILASLLSARRKNQLLARQKAELEDKNEEISTQRDEIEAQRNLVFDQKQAIEQASEEITHSIEYAKRLQAAALPVMSFLSERVEDQFVLFKPRDIVSGDFYWFAEVEDKIVVTVADSTGHGVPGAFMSMMGMSLLKEIVQKEYLTHPGVILRRMRKEIINTMGQKGVSGEQRDGMDMALVTIDNREKKLDYAGAFNSLYLMRKKNAPAPVLETGVLEADMEINGICLYEIPADKMPIAHYDRMDKFINHEIPFLEGDAIYLFTDGFADQFGGEKGKKFMYKPFKRLLLKNSQLSMEKQHDILARTIDDWMGPLEQVDDICVMGIRL